VATTSPLTTFSGLASGIDSAALIKSMMTIANQPVTRLQAKQSVNSSMSKKFTDIKAKMVALQTAAKALDTRNEAMVNKASSSDDKILAVTAAGGASLGAFDIEVTSVAKAERTYSDPLGASNQAGLFGTGTLSIQVGSGSAVDVTIDTQDTLSSVASKINTANAGVTAGIVYDGSQYRLQVSGNETGASKAITFGETSTLTLGLSVGANQFQAASDAVLMIDDIEVHSASNSVTSAIPGVTISVVAEGTAKVEIGRDPDGLKTKLDSFVTAYNDVMKVMNTEFAYSGTQKSAGSLSGDSTLRTAQTELRGLMTQDLTGITSSFSSLGSLGIAVQRDGTISVDAEKLKTAVNKDYEGVTTALAGANGLMSQVVDRIDPYVRSDGAISSRITNLATRNRDIDSQVSRMQTRLDKYEEQLQRQFSQLESLMSSLQSQGASLSTIISSS
jgi:flagellar hook-associated protein 2